MAKFTVDSLREKTAEAFDDVVFEDEGVVFQHYLRIPEKDREKILDLIKNLDDEDAEEDGKDALAVAREIYEDILQGVADDKEKAKILLSKFDLPILMTLFSEWVSVTRLGEASSS
jgi:hypothetical protein